MSYFLLQKRPDGHSEWEDEEGTSYHFARKLPNAKNLCKNDIVLFYRPQKSGTPEDGCIYARATVATVEIGDKGRVDAGLTEYVDFNPVPLSAVGDPRANAQHSSQPVTRDFYLSTLRAAGAAEGTTG